MQMNSPIYNTVVKGNLHINNIKFRKKNCRTRDFGLVWWGIFEEYNVSALRYPLSKIRNFNVVNIHM